MALTITADWPTGIDESGGNQVVANQKHDVSSFDAAIAALFDSQLEDYYGNTDTTLADAAQLAGNPDEGDPITGNDVVVTSDGAVTGLSLTDESGDLFDGTYNSGLTTLEDHQINLLSGTDDNFVLGIDSVTNDVIFMIYLAEETDLDGNVVGGDFYVALFGNINHGDDGNDFDGVLDLANKLYVSAESVLDFDFTGAPSGQNEFMAFESGGIVIVASGEANGDSVNSGQGANFPGDPDKTALGTNSNDIGAQETLNFNFTTGWALDPDPTKEYQYVVPDLTPTEASDQNNIQFTDVYEATGASFNVVKVTGLNQNTGLYVNVSVWNTEDAASGMLETGTEFISGHADDTMATITAIYVNGVDVTANVTVEADGSWTIDPNDITENSRVLVEGTGFNRIAIKNNGNDQVAYSVQSFALETRSLDTTEVGSQIDFYDDGPSAGGLAVDLDLWEDALPTIGNPDGDTGEQYIATGSLTGLFDPGSDVTGYSFGINPTPPATISTLQGPSDLVFDVTVTEDANVLAGGVTYDDQVMLSIGGTDYIQILVKSDGNVRVELLNPLDDSLINNPSDNDNEFYTIQYGDLFAAFDGDGDYVTFNAEDVGSDIEDDAPTFSMTDLNATIETDDGDLAGGNTGDGTGNDTDTVTAGTLFSTASSGGADGAGGTLYNLELGGTTATNLVDTATGNSVYLVDNGGVIEGREGTDQADAATGEIVFTVSVNASGDVTLTQMRAVEHYSADTSGYASDTTGLGVTDAILLRGTFSDGETAADTATDTIDLSDNLSFTDDGPAINVLDASGTYGAGAAGTWTDSPGADDYADSSALSISLDSYQIDANGLVDPSPDVALLDQGGGRYTFSITDDFNADGVDDTIPFELQMNGDGTYSLTTTKPPATVVSFDTSGGTLDAGGPDPVRTLTTDEGPQIVFSAVNPTASPSDISGDLDQGEAYIEANATYLSAEQLNVSTSGIANGNNVLEGNALAGEPDGVTTKGGKVDESFVIDPLIDISSMKVFIDNSVGGYNTSTEELYYRTYDVDGTWSGWTKVEAGDLTAEAGGQVSFIVGDPLGDNDIDAVQLGMGTGTVKIPLIAFTTSQEFNPEPITLNFDATLVDGDGDSFTDDFTVFLDVDPVV